MAMATSVPLETVEALPSFRAFRFSEYIDLDKNRRATGLDLIRLLQDKCGLSIAVPLQVGITAKDVELLGTDWWFPRYDGPRQWPFVWEGVSCSIDFISPGEAVKYYTFQSFVIRVYDLTPSIGERVLTEIGRELAARWKPADRPIKKTSIYRAVKICNGTYGWSFFVSRDSRDLDTVYLDTGIKDKIVKGLDFFFSNKPLYDRTGVTWKRIHLLHGPPGTGKTSMCVAMASRFDRDIAKLSITGDIKATDIDSLLSSLSTNTFLLLEDVDALFAKRSSKTGVDFSTLINALDGVATASGLVVFMTTNHLDKLEPALIRPGRVDFCAEITVPSREAVLEALRTLAPEYAHEHEEFVDRFAKGITIAGVQKHIFDCLVEEKESILFEVKALAPLPSREKLVVGKGEPMEEDEEDSDDTSHVSED
ncbi:hypothetical protein HDU93_000380 [Gonapodya sp. JEL0774]|nr:hypothetical protein HDU93_000380 [Gonapodya sp. JEL0774]